MSYRAADIDVYAKHRLSKFKGIKKENFLLHPKECEFRFNNSKDTKTFYHILLKLIRENPLNLSWAFLFKLIFHFILGGNLKEFSLFPAITIYHYEVLASTFSRAGSSKWNDMRGKFHMIYIIKKQDYLDLQKYFSDKKHINLNLVEKKF